MKAIACGDYNRDKKDELFVLRGTSTAAGLYIYRAPSKVGAAIGKPMASVPKLGSGILGLAAANFDTDKTNLEVAILARTSTGKRALKIHRSPTKVNGTLGVLVASVDSVDSRFVGVKGILYSAASQAASSNACAAPTLKIQ